ncbi:phage tail tape measure protein [Enterococcus ureasiticus]|uniref:phage tail tape measure protein n=1 Tax=Enterococcus ureasiticus TaxID=903984 RepID=UPI001A8D7E43|nr:phage tail tape measure protein [Enterococcus ureasiticus]MBO0475400.1 phage tail tape measure protein [Enterococcus ureasiticus]
MSEKISDVVLRFKTNGEVSYSKTIKSINKEMNIAAAEYKNQVAAMDKNATQTEKLTATKQKLEKQLELASKRSQMLREEFEKSVQETGRYSDQSQKLYKQLLDSENGQQSLKVSLEETNKELKKQGDVSVDTAEKIQKIEKAGEKIQGVGKKLSIGVTAPIMAAKAASVKAYEDMRASQAKLINQTGKTGEEAEKLKVSLKNLYGSSAKDSGELADALGTVTQRFDVSGKAAEDMTKKFLTFARVNDVDAPNAIEKVSRAMGDAEIETSQYGEVLDLLTVASKKSGIEVDKLTENLAKYGAPMRQLGFDTKSSIAIFATWEKAGVNTEIAFSGMRKAISTWGKEGKVPMEEFPKAMKKIEESTNPVADAIEIFGAKAGPDLADAIQGGRFNVEEMTKALDGAGGKLDEIGGESGNPMSKMTIAMHNLNLALMPFGEIIIEAMIPAVQKFAEFMQGLVATLDGMDDGTRKTIVVIGLLAAAIGPTLMIIGSLASSLGKGVAAIKTLMSAWSAMSALFGLTGGWMAVVVIAIAALVAGLIWAYNNVQWFHDGVNAFFQGVSDVAVEVFNFMAGFIGDSFGGILANFQNFYDAGSRILGGLVDFISGVFTGNWQQAWQGLSDIVGGIFDGMAAIVKAPLNMIIGMVNAMIGGLNNIKLPKWVPGIGGKGVNIGKIPYLAEGGHLINGQAIVGEAGPELLTAKNGKTTVTPLSDTEKRKGISGKYDGNVTVEQHNHFGNVDANNPSELMRLNRQMKQAANLTGLQLGGF